MSYDICLTIDTGGDDPVEVPGTWINYTSNVAFMWRRALPELDGLAGLDGRTAASVADLLAQGVLNMETLRPELEPLNPENGWGNWMGARATLAVCANAARDHPKATFRVSR